VVTDVDDRDVDAVDAVDRFASVVTLNTLAHSHRINDDGIDYFVFFLYIRFSLRQYGTFRTTAHLFRPTV